MRWIAGDLLNTHHQLRRLADVSSGSSSKHVLCQSHPIVCLIIFPLGQRRLTG